MFEAFLKNHTFAEYTFRSDIFPTVEDRAFWDAFQNDECVALAEAALDFDWPIIKATDYMELNKSGNRQIMEDPHFERRRHLVLFTLAELKENRGRFLPQIINGLYTICEESYWGLSAHWISKPGNIPTPAEPYIDLFAAETAEHLVLICHMFRRALSTLCPEILTRVRYEINYRIKETYEQHRDFVWMGYLWRRQNNWNPWILSNLLTVFLLDEKDEVRLHRALEKMFHEIECYYETLPEDGGCDEGPAYWNRAGASLFEFLYQLKQSTNGELDLFGDAKIGRIATYMKTSHVVSDLFYNVADAHAKGQPEAMPLLFLYGEQTHQTDLMNFSASVYRVKNTEKALLSHTEQTLRRLVYQSMAVHRIMSYPITYPIHDPVEILPDLEIAAIRSGDFCLNAKGGSNGDSHNHNDVGSYTLYDGETPILIDVGICTYTRFTFRPEYRYSMIPWTRTLYHNLPLPNGVEQKAGDEFRTDSFSAREGEINVSFAKAYPDEAGIRTLTRSLTLCEQGLTCTDRFAFANDASQSVTEVLVTTLPSRIEGNSVILKDAYRIYADCGAVTTEFTPFQDPKLESDWNTNGVTRILFTAENAKEIRITVERI